MGVAFVVSAVLLMLAAAYAVSLLRLRTGFRAACKQYLSSTGENDLGDGNADSGPFASVVVPARNESANVTACLESIFKNDYERFEVILVDDASDDDTAARSYAFGTTHQLADRLKVIKLEDRDQDVPTGHKKQAIQVGIDNSRGDIILTTDADSIVPEGWISSLISSFSAGVNFVSAPVAYPDGSSLLDRALALEMLGLVAIGGGAIATGRPNMCNGANLAYRRQTYEQVGGFSGIDHLASGDDALLMLKIAANDPTAVRFCADPGALVVTSPANGWRNLLNQRKRWASKGLRYSTWHVTLLAVLVYVFHALLLGSTLSAFFVPALRLPVFAAILAKIGVEWLLLRDSCRQFGRHHLMRSFLPAELLQVPYVSVVGLLGVAGGGFAWKGRSLKR